MLMYSVLATKRMLVRLLIHVPFPPWTALQSH